MNIIKIKQFITVCDSDNNISNAAEKLFMTQASLSQSIMILEKELGYSVFDRNKKKLVLNQNGKAILSYCREIVGTYEKMKDTLRIANEEKIYNVISVDDAVFTMLFSRFKLAFFDTQIEHKVISDDIALVEELLISKQADIALTAEPATSANIECFPLIEDRQYFICPADSPLYGRGSIDISGIVGLPFYRGKLEQEYSITAVLNDALARNDIHLKTYYDSDFKSEIFGVGEFYYFVCILALLRPYGGFTSDKKRMIKITNEEIKLSYYVCYLKNKNNKINIFLDWLKGSFTDTKKELFKRLS